VFSPHKTGNIKPWGPLKVAYQCLRWAQHNIDSFNAPVILILNGFITHNVSLHLGTPNLFKLYNNQL
jgi:hypothetical protein